jgi:hypothetical protein
MPQFCPYAEPERVGFGVGPHVEHVPGDTKIISSKTSFWGVPYTQNHISTGRLSEQKTGPPLAARLQFRPMTLSRLDRASAR